MATIKVLLRTHNTLRNGEHPIVLRIIKDRKAKFIFTGQSCPAHLWDHKENKPLKKHPNRFELELFISKKIEQSQKVILGLENEHKDYSAEAVKKRFRVSTSKITVFKYLDNTIADLVKQNRTTILQQRSSYQLARRRA
jgi:hypothetical protein